MEMNLSLETLGKAGREAVAAIKDLPDDVILQYKEDLPAIREAFETFSKGKGTKETLDALRDLRNKTIAAPEGSNAEWNVWNKYVLVGTLNRTASLEEIYQSIEEKVEEGEVVEE